LTSSFPRENAPLESASGPRLDDRDGRLARTRAPTFAAGVARASRQRAAIPRDLAARRPAAAAARVQRRPSPRTPDPGADPAVRLQRAGRCGPGVGPRLELPGPAAWHARRKRLRDVVPPPTGAVWLRCPPGALHGDDQRPPYHARQPRGRGSRTLA